MIRFSRPGAGARGHLRHRRILRKVFRATATTSIISEFLVSKVGKRRMRIARRKRLGPGNIAGEDSGRERERRGRGLDSSCTVNNTPPGRDRLAHPRHPATIYLLFVPYTFVLWPPLPSAVPRVFTAAETRRERLSMKHPALLLQTFLHQTLAGGSTVLAELCQKEI